MSRQFFKGDISIGEGSMIEPRALIIGPQHKLVVIFALVTELFCEIV